MSLNRNNILQQVANGSCPDLNGRKLVSAFKEAGYKVNRKNHDLLITAPSGDKLSMTDYDSAPIVISGTHNALSKFINKTYQHNDASPV